MIALVTRLQTFALPICEQARVAGESRDRRHAAAAFLDRIDHGAGGALAIGPGRDERGEAIDTAALREGDHPLDRSEEHTSELQSLMRISYAVLCLKKKKTTNSTICSINLTRILHHHQSSIPIHTHKTDI